MIERKSRVEEIIQKSNFISRDLSWLQFNHRVLDQAFNTDKNIFERLKFLAITASNLDEFFMIRVGSLYNFIDYGKEKRDYSELKTHELKKSLYSKTQDFFKRQYQCYQELDGKFEDNRFKIAIQEELKKTEKEEVARYFEKTVFPMLTPMVFDSYHAFPIIRNKALVFGIISQSKEKNAPKKISFVQVPQNLPRFYEIDRDGIVLFIPIEDIIKSHISKLYRNINLLTVNLFRITRNGDFTLEESDEMEADFISEVRNKLKTRRTGRVVRVEVLEGFSEQLMRIVKRKWMLDADNIFVVKRILDFTDLWQIIKHPDFKNELPKLHGPVAPLSMESQEEIDLFEFLKNKDILLHHPYNSMDTVLELLEQAADDPNVLAIKLTIYRFAQESRITSALLKAVENGKHVSVLFELKARFDEENNIREARKLQKAGCFVIYGIGGYKTHTKLLLIVRKEADQITRYVHMSSGNYNEDTAKLYTDIGLLSSNEAYAKDVSEFFNVITGHSAPSHYENIITAPHDMRQQLIDLIKSEADHARKKQSSGIVIKINSLEDKEVIEALYEASQEGVPIKLIVRGICCLRPKRKGLSENIEVISIVGNFLEHSRLYYFHQNNQPKIYGGSADVMIRSFDRRIESLFLIKDEFLKKQAMNILAYNLKDNINAYLMHEDGTYQKRSPKAGEAPFNIHQEFFQLNRETIEKVHLF